MLTSGRALIAKALGQFEAVKAQLLKGAQQCRSKALTGERLAEEVSVAVHRLRHDADRADRAVACIDRLLNGGE